MIPLLLLKVHGQTTFTLHLQNGHEHKIMKHNIKVRIQWDSASANTEIAV